MRTYGRTVHETSYEFASAVIRHICARPMIDDTRRWPANTPTDVHRTVTDGRTDGHSRTPINVALRARNTALCAIRYVAMRCDVMDEFENFSFSPAVVIEFDI